MQELPDRRRAAHSLGFLKASQSPKLHGTNAGEFLTNGPWLGMSFFRSKRSYEFVDLRFRNSVNRTEFLTQTQAPANTSPLSGAIELFVTRGIPVGGKTRSIKF